MINPVGTVSSDAPSIKKHDVAGAAKQFESLMLTQILRSVREAGGSEGWLGSGEDAASSSAMEMAEEQFASALSAQGGFGLARMVTANLQQTAKE